MIYEHCIQTVYKLVVMKAFLEIIIGPMFSGKTSKLLEIYKQCKFCNIEVCVINHYTDKRYSQDKLSSHDGIMIPCFQVEKISDIIDVNLNTDNIIQNNNYNSSEVVLINEGQFFPDLYECVLKMLSSNKKVYVCGLDGDFERNKFGQILDLIPHCDKVQKLHSLCGKCKTGEPGIFSKRLSDEKEQTVVGNDNYIPVCRMCYEKQ